jgi:folate-binding protein YgfZ
MNTPITTGALDTEIDALLDGAGLADLSARTQIEVSGADRASFLHNLSTNEIRKLKPGSGCEAFFCDARGHIQSHVYIFCREQSLVIDSVPGAADALLSHLDRYLIREDVQLTNRSGEWCELLLAGPRSGELLSRLTGVDLAALAGRVATVEASLAGNYVQIRRFDFAGPDSYAIVGASGARDGIWIALRALGATPCSGQAVEALRIAAGSPLFGVDITSRNLPQEVARDEWTISFVKGCYLGQETVARIDALGHVNRLLCGLKFSLAGPGDLPAAPGMALSVGGQSIGEISSAAQSARLGQVSLGYVRREHATPGSRLESPAGTVEVAKLPQFGGG